MRRLLPLLLLVIPALCWATAAESDQAPKNGACVYARPAATATVAEAEAPQARPATPAAARSTPKPIISLPANIALGGLSASNCTAAA